jgi:hypothetical protein
LDAEDINDGWISLYRCLLKKAIWQKSTTEQKVILITLLLMANHEQREWEWEGEKFMVPEGGMITSLKSIKKNAGKSISFQNIRTAIEKFQKFEFLTNKSTKTGRLIIINNFEEYQGKFREANNKNKKTNKGINKQVTKVEPKTNNQVTKFSGFLTNKLTKVEECGNWRNKAQNQMDFKNINKAINKEVKKVPQNQQSLSKNLTSNNNILINNNNNKEEIYKEEKIKYADYVLLTEKEYNKLIDKYGEDNTIKMITVLDNYKGAKPKKRKYDSDYRAILNWVVGKVIQGNKNKINWNDIKLEGG